MIWNYILLEIQIAINGSFIYYPNRVYHSHIRGEGGFVVEGDYKKDGSY